MSEVRIRKIEIICEVSEGHRGLLLSVSKSGIRFINAVADTTENPENYWPSQEEIKKAIERCRKIQNFLPDVEAILESKISSQKIPDAQQLKLFD